ncbi:FAD-dependent oxidoreductase [Aquabacterium sp.]|uniref:FAD/NAD(P)-dependent oxidoreductase n=1 Tax=Aquabacterium sp. TaxID=1872578 RepID=UPI0037852450
MSGSLRAVIVGAGPAGLRAAEQLVEAGLRPVLVDEAERVGGQIYRQPPPALRRDGRALYGFEAGKAAALFARFEALKAQLDHRPGTLVWHLEDRQLHLLRGAATEVLPFDALILATGATERVLPFPGWTLPGVLTLGAAQIALKAQASLVGPRVVFAGTGPLLYLVAWQYLKAGGQVQAVLDSAPPGAALRALPGLLARPAMAARGAWMLARLRAAGVALRQGATLLRAEGAGRVESLLWQDSVGVHHTPCDAVAFSHGLRSETQLADLAGCAFEFDPLDQAWRPKRDAAGRSSVAGVYLAGDGAAVLGADAAELAGARAALALLQDHGQPSSADQAGRLQRRLQAQQRFRAGLERMAAPPAQWAAEAPDDLIVCRCEEVTAGELRACVRDTGARELNRLKAQTRIGMGRCQGRMCGAAAARLLADAAGCSLAEVGRLRGQPPVKPVPIAALADLQAASRPVPQDQADD